VRLPKSEAAKTFVCVAVLGTLAGPIAGWTGYSLQTSWSMRRAEAATVQAVEPTESVIVQVSNSNAKADRLAVTASAALAVPTTSFRLASVDPQNDPTGDAASAEPAMPPNAAAYAAPSPMHPAPLPPHKRKPPAESQNGILDDAQIASIKRRLRLSPDQQQYWPAVEAALREFGRQQTKRANRNPRLAKGNIDMNSPEVQQLIFAAMPLLRILREEQKREVRTLVRIIGLEKVAAQI
jgi:hypothetical protein